MSLFGSYNKVTVMGKMTRDPELRKVGNDNSVCGFTVAVNESVKKGDKWEDETTFVDCTAWGKTAELLERFGGKGKTILIDGRLKMDKWQDKATGENRSKMGVVVNAITFCDAKEPSGSNAGNNERQQRRGGKTPQRQSGGDDYAGGYASSQDDLGDPDF